MSQELKLPVDLDPDAARSSPTVQTRATARKLGRDLLEVERVELARMVQNGLDQRVAAAVRRQLDIASVTPRL